MQVHVGRRPDGSKDTRSRTITGTRRDAERLATQMQAQVDVRKIRPGDNLTVAQLVERWCDLEGDSWSPRTLADTRSVLDAHLGPLADVRIDRLTRAQVATHLAQLRDAGVGAATRAKAHSRLRAALSFAVRLDLIATNPAKDVRAPKATSTRGRAATPTEVAAVLHAADDDPEMAAFVRLTAVTGARRGEVCALRWADVAGDTITWTRGVVDGGPGHGLVVKELKVDRPKRTVVGQGTLDALARWQIAVAADDLLHDEATPWIFPGVADRSQPVRPDLMSKRWRRLCARAGVPAGMRIHDLRHGVATDGLGEGFSAVDVAARLGHSRPSTTSDMYAHAAPARDRALSEVLEARLDQALSAPRRGTRRPAR